MEIIDFTVYRGRNIYSHHPIIKMIVDTQEQSETPTKEIEGFNERLLKAFPTIAKDTCGLGYEGGFGERLQEGTYLAHVLEHAIINLQNTIGFSVKYGKTRLYEEPSQYYLIFEYENEICAIECAKTAVFILNQFIQGKDVPMDEFVDYLQKVMLETELGPSTKAIVKEAKKRNIPVSRIGYESLIRLGYGKHSRLIEATLSDTTSCIAVDISSNKQLTKAILDEYKIPVPYGKVVFTEISAVMAANQIGFPVVVKPFNGNHGNGVQINLTTEDAVRKAYKEASKYSSGVIVEKFCTGNDYRILVVGDQVKAVAQRVPAMVVGDGKHTIQELVDIVNQDPSRGESHEKALTKIRIGPLEKSVLQRRGIDETYVPSINEEVRLRENGNISSGGIAIDFTDEIHPDNADFAIRAAKALGIDIAGVDMVAEDISKSICSSSGAVIEVNTAPGIRMHLYPSKGQPRNVAKNIVDHLFPDNSATDFPIVSVTGTNGKTTTVRLISHVLETTGMTVGMTSTSGSYVAQKCICKGDNSGPRSAKSLLGSKDIDVAVLETARGGILREGLGYDLATVGVITNVTEDHMGLNGVNTLEDLANVKALVAEAVKPNGYAVLNAEDPMTQSIVPKVSSEIIYFCKDRNQAVVDTQGHIVVFAQDGFIKIQEKQTVLDVAKIADIPITQGGILECNISNCLAAVAVLYGLHVSLQTISKGLCSFESNPGRFQLFQRNGYQVMLDYAHNPAGYQEIIKTIKRLKHKRLIGVIGMPGDRPDHAIKEVGAITSDVFDKIYIKEDQDLRNRQKNEVPNLLYESLIENQYDPANIMVIEDEVQALSRAMEEAQSEDLIVVLYENLNPLLQLFQ